MKKKVLAMLMASAMVFSLTACGGSAETVVEETQQEEIVEDSSTKEETRQEETVVETSPKEEVVEETQEVVEEVEEPTDDSAPFQPTSRIAHIAQGGITGDVTETLEYNADGYTVKGRVDSQKAASSHDYEFRYNDKGEVTYVKIAYYNENRPNGLVSEIDFIHGYPVSATTNETVKYDEYSGYSRTQDGIYSISDGNYVDEGYTLVDSNGDFLGSYMKNIAYIVYESPLEMFRNGFGAFPVYERDESLKDSKLSVSVEENKIFVASPYTEEVYDVEQRENVNKEKYSSVDIISYGENGLIESIKNYSNPSKDETFSPTNLEVGQDNGGVYYVYDSKGNVLEYKVKKLGQTEIVVTYDYGNGTQTVNETQTVSDSEDTTSASIEGRWRCRSENYPYDAIFFDSDGTGNLYKGIDAYPLKYTFDGTKAYVTADGQEFTFYVYLDENKMIEGESDAPYDKEQ